MNLKHMKILIHVKSATGQGDDYPTGCLLNNSYFTLILKIAK